MFKSSCICQRGGLVSFKKKIEYKDETVFKAYNGIVIARCPTCGTLKTFHNKKKSFDPKQSRGDYYEENLTFFKELFAPIVSKVDRYATGKRILDVGCSSGILMQLLQDGGYDVYGIEPNKQAYDLLKKKFPKRVFNGTMEESSTRKSFPLLYDVIIYNHVLEHIEDPVKELRYVSQILKKDGILIIGVPNTRNIIFILREKYWEPLMPLEHIWHFRKPSFTSMLVGKEYSILDVSYTDDERSGYPLPKRLYFHALSFINRLVGTGEAMLIIAQKKK